VPIHRTSERSLAWGARQPATNKKSQGPYYRVEEGLVGNVEVVRDELLLGKLLLPSQKLSKRHGRGGRSAHLSVQKVRNGGRFRS
jgi:hypothetical protein